MKLRVRALDEEYASLVFRRLKKSSSTVVSDNQLEVETSVFVENPTVFCECLAWKASQIKKCWEDYFDMEPAVD